MKKTKSMVYTTLVEIEVEVGVELGNTKQYLILRPMTPDPPLPFPIETPYTKHFE